MDRSRVKYSASHLIGTIGVLFIIALTLACGDISAFIDLSSLIITYGATFFLLLFIFGKDLFSFLHKASIMIVSKPREPDHRSADISLYASRLLVGIGSIVTMAGFIRVFQYLDDPCAIGQVVSSLLLPVLYGVFASEVICIPLYKAFIDGDESKSGSFSRLYLLFPLLLVILALFVFLIITLATGATDDYSLREML